MRKIVLLDGNSIMFRAYYATAYTGNLMKTSNGLYTNAVYGFVNMMNSILSIDGLTHIFVAFDKGKKTFRQQDYADYKGGRKPMPEEFAMQIPYIKKYIDILGIKRLELDEFEADDIIGTMSKKAKDYFDEVMIISGDKDLLQLVGDNVKVCLTKKGISDLEEYNKDNFASLMGFSASQMTDYKALIGDSSDNLPGLSGVGPKTAVKLLESYQTIENIISHVDQLKGKLQETVKNEAEIAKRTKMLATIATNAPIEYSFDDLEYAGPNLNELHSFFEELEFQSFLKKMNFKQVEKKEKQENIVNYHFNELEETIKVLECSNEVALEVELDGDNYHRANILGIAIASENNGYYLKAEYLKDDKLKKALTLNKNILTIDSKKTYVSLKYQNIEISQFAFDLILGAYVVNPSYGNMDVKSIFEKFIETNIVFHEEIYGKKATYDVPNEEVYAKYAIDKCQLLLATHKIIEEKIKTNDQTKLYYEVELPLAPILGDIEMQGFKVNRNRLNEIGTYLQDEIKKAEESIFALAGHEFNVSSPKQLGVVLFEEMKVGKPKKTKTGYSTSAEVLEELAKVHPIANLVLDYRKYAKLYSTYVVGLLDETSEEDPKVHTIFKQALTLTGRLSSTEPNIQNIPVRTVEGRIIRTAFVPSNEDGWLVSADYSQIELRILATLSKCSNMLDAFNNNVDLHASTASKVFNKNIDEVTKEERRMAKAVNFGIVYGISDWGLAEQLHIMPYEADAFIKKYFEIYPEIKNYLDECVSKTKELGYTITVYNRRRYMPEINSSNAALRKFSERASMNAPIQGTAADVMKIAMINVYNKMKEAKLASKIVAQVHDELIVDVVKEELETVKVIVKETMENTVQIGVKLACDVEYGETWDLK